MNQTNTPVPEKLHKVTAVEVSAVALFMKDGGKAILVQAGDEWHGLRRFICVAPQDLEGHEITIESNGLVLRASPDLWLACYGPKTI